MHQDNADGVTVIIVNWNGERFLEQCLSALAQQTRPADEIIVVDNASTDGSLTIARRFPRIRLMALESNTGFARGNNLAIAAASPASRWIVLLNPDAFPEPDWLTTLLDAARSRPDCAAFGSRLIDAQNPKKLDGAGDACHISGLVWRTGHGQPVPEKSQHPHEIFSPCAAAAMYRRDALQEIGGFDEDYFCYVEDVDLGFRLRLAGYGCLSVPQSVAHHVGSGTTGSQHSDFALYHGHRNLVWTFVKNMPGALFWLLLPLHLALNLFSLVWFALHGHGRVILHAKRDALRGLPAIWKKRQKIQKTRRADIKAIWARLEKKQGKPAGASSG